jgi:hypothetical protein
MDGRVDVRTAKPRAQWCSEAIARWEEATLSGQSQGTNILEYARTFLASTGLIRAVEATAPDLMEEIHGIAEAAGLPRSSSLRTT